MKKIPNKSTSKKKKEIEKKLNKIYEAIADIYCSLDRIDSLLIEIEISIDEN